MQSFERDIMNFQNSQEESIYNNVNNSLQVEVNDIVKGIFTEWLNKSNSTDEFFKSWSGDLQKRFPNGVWRRVGGSNVFINNGKVIAGLNGFNQEIDKFFENKKKDSEGKKVTENNKNVREFSASDGGKYVFTKDNNGFWETSKISKNGKEQKFSGKTKSLDGQFNDMKAYINQENLPTIGDEIVGVSNNEPKEENTFLKRMSDFVNKELKSKGIKQDDKRYNAAVSYAIDDFKRMVLKPSGMSKEDMDKLEKEYKSPNKPEAKKEEGKLKENEKELIVNAFKKNYGLQDAFELKGRLAKEDAIVALAQQTGLRNKFIEDNFEEIQKLPKQQWEKPTKDKPVNERSNQEIGEAKWKESKYLPKEESNKNSIIDKLKSDKSGVLLINNAKERYDKDISENNVYAIAEKIVDKESTTSPEMAIVEALQYEIGNKDNNYFGTEKQLAMDVFEKLHSSSINPRAERILELNLSNNLFKKAKELVKKQTELKNNIQQIKNIVSLKLLKTATDKLELSINDLNKTIDIANKIKEIDKDKEILPQHIAESIQYLDMNEIKESMKSMDEKSRELASQRLKQLYIKL